MPEMLAANSTISHLYNDLDISQQRAIEVSSSYTGVGTELTTVPIGPLEPPVMCAFLQQCH